MNKTGEAKGRAEGGIFSLSSRWCSFTAFSVVSGLIKAATINFILAIYFGFASFTHSSQTPKWYLIKQG